MPTERRALYNSPNGDRWFVCRDADARRTVIRHEANLPSGGHVTEIDIETFLRQGCLHPEHEALLRLISTSREWSSRLRLRRRRLRYHFSTNPAPTLPGTE